MTITINGTTGVAGVDGTAATPALQGNDTDTGVYFGTNEVYISTGGTLRATVGNSGLTLTTPLSAANGGTGLTSLTAGRIPYGNGTGAFSNSGDLSFDGTRFGVGTSGISLSTYGRAVVKQSANNYAGGLSVVRNDTDAFCLLAYDASPGVFRFGPTYNSTGAFHPLAFYTSDVERMRIDASGNVGIGTITPGAKLEVNGGNLFVNGQNIVATDGSGYWAAGNSTYTCGWFGSSGAMIFRAGGSSERMRIDTSGNLAIGSTTAYGKLDVLGNGNANSLHITNSANADTGAYINATGSAECMFSGGATYNSYSAPNFVMNAKSTVASGVYIQGNAISFWVNTGLTAGTTFNQTERMNISSSGTIKFNNYGAGTLSTSSSGVISASDGRYKNKTRSLDNGLSYVMALQPTYYRWKESSPFYSEDEELGFIAQEVASVIPEASPEFEEPEKFRNYHDRAVLAVVVK